MRVSTAYIFDQNLSAMLNQQTALGKTQLQISTGKKIINPSDDPSGSVQILNLQREASVTEQHQLNADKAENKQAIEEGTLQSATDMLQRIKELAVQGLNGTNTQTDRAAIAAEINQLNEQLLALANTRDSNGDYLFSGFQSNTQPYQTISGSYQGDQGQRNMQVGPGVLIETNDPGNAIFEAALIQTSVTIAGVGTGALSITNDTGVGETFGNTLFTTGSHISTSSITQSNYLAPNNTSFDVDGITVSLTADYGSIDGVVSEIQDQLEALSPGSYLVSTDASNRLIISGAVAGSNTALASSIGIDAYTTTSSMTLANMDFTASGGLNAQFEISDDTLTNLVVDFAGNNYSTPGIGAGSPQVDGFNNQTLTGYDFSGAGLAQFDVDGIGVTLTTALGNDAGLKADLESQLPGYTVTVNGVGDIDISKDGSLAAVAITNVDINAGIAGFIASAGTSGAVATASGDAAGVQFAADITGQLVAAGSNTVATWAVDVSGFSGHLVFTSGEMGSVGIPPSLSNIGIDLTGAALSAPGTPTAGKNAVGSTSLAPVVNNFSSATVADFTTGVSVNGVDAGDASISLTYSATPSPQYVVNFGDNPPVIIDYTDGMILDFAKLGSNFPSVKVALTGSPSNGDVITLSKEVTEQSQTMFKTINDFAAALTANKVGLNDSPNNGDFLTNISSSLNKVIDAQSRVGIRMNNIDQQREINNGLLLNMKSTLSGIQDLDYAEAISKLSLQMAGLQAAQQSFVKVQGLSLFNYL